MLRIEHDHSKIVFNVKGTPVASFYNTYKIYMTKPPIKPIYIIIKRYILLYIKTFYFEYFD